MKAHGAAVVQLHAFLTSALDVDAVSFKLRPVHWCKKTTNNHC